MKYFQSAQFIEAESKKCVCQEVKEGVVHHRHKRSTLQMNTFSKLFCNIVPGKINTVLGTSVNERQISCGGILLSPERKKLLDKATQINENTIALHPSAISTSGDVSRVPSALWSDWKLVILVQAKR